jgi:hypothetical protein
MTDSDFSGSWIIRSSTSRFFPLDSVVNLERKATSFDLDVVWEGQPNLKLVDKNFLPENGALNGFFRRPKPGQPEKEEEFQLVVIRCPVGLPDQKPRLLGLLTQKGEREPGSTGVWMAEEQKEPEPLDRST